MWAYLIPRLAAMVILSAVVLVPAYLLHRTGPERDMRERRYETCVHCAARFDYWLDAVHSAMAEAPCTAGEDEQERTGPQCPVRH